MRYTCNICDVYLMPSNHAKGFCPFGHAILDDDIELIEHKEVIVLPKKEKNNE